MCYPTLPGVRGQALQRGTATAAQAKSQSDTLYDISKPKST